MSGKQFSLTSRIGELMELLETIQSNRIQSVVVRIDTEEGRTYSIDGIRDALSSLETEVVSASETAIVALEARYEHNRADVFRIVGRLAEIVAATSTGDEYRTTTKHFSTF